MLTVWELTDYQTGLRALYATSEMAKIAGTAHALDHYGRLYVQSWEGCNLEVTTKERHRNLPSQNQYWVTERKVIGG